MAAVFSLTLDAPDTNINRQWRPTANNNNRHMMPATASLVLSTVVLCFITVQSTTAAAFATVPQKTDAAAPHNVNDVPPVLIADENADDEIINNHLVIPNHHDKTAAETTSSSTLLPIWKMALAGCLATMVGDAAMHPLDCIKTLQQSDEGVGLGFISSIMYLWQTYGILGFYHGLGTYAASDGGGGALKFATYEVLKKEAQKRLPDMEDDGVINFMCAAVAFVVSSAVIVPGELLKQQLQMSRFDSLWQAVTGILDNQGLSGFFVGYEGVCLRDVPYTMIELGLYDLLKQKMISSNSSDNHDKQNKNTSLSLDPWQEVVAAAVTGGVAAFVTTPLDTIKTKVMVDHYDSFGDCFLQTMEQHGYLSVFAGAGARVAWLVPFTALYLPIYDAIKRQMMMQQQQKQEKVTSS